MPAEGRVAVKISTGEAGNNNHLKAELIGPLVQLVNGKIVECNTAYAGSRMNTEDHLKVIEEHGFNTIGGVDIMDADGEIKIPVRDTIKAYAKFPIAETAQHAEPLLKVIKNYKITTRENYMKESGLIDNMLQDLLQYERQLNRLGLLIVANQLKAKNDEVRQLIAQRGAA